ncbi:RluA family pseudouridine synthase [Candidatus Gracilibacteria bacterium]|nr:RluA family pseudouridine synthase [Candidatus Gracilibacteria bacterium]
MRSSNNYSISHFSVFCDERETRRVDTYLSALFPEKSRSYLQKMIEEGKIYCNCANFTKNKKIYRGDEIRIEWKVENMTLEAEDMPLNIVFENDDFAIINKDAGINTHPTPGAEGRKGTLVNALLYHFKNLGVRTDETGFCHPGLVPGSSNENNIIEDSGFLHSQEGQKQKSPSIINGVERPGIVHRLDKDTSGLIIIAKNDRAMHALQLKIAKRTISKMYLALVIGNVKDEDGYIESYIGRDPNDRKKMTTRDPVNPKIAKTKFRKLGYYHDKYSLLEVDLLTGRTHQIRVHLSSIGYPIIGDKIYGNEKANREVLESFGLKRQWLHAWKLEFTLFGKEYAFLGEVKDDLKKVID